MKKFLLLLLGIIVATLTLAQQPKAVQIEKSGKGTPVLMMPGFITPGSVWDETMKNMKGTYEYHQVSYAGFNNLAPIPMPWYAAIKSELIAYIEANQLRHLTLVGHSMGGNLAVDLASQLGDAVSRVVIVDAIPCMRELMMPGVKAETLQYDSPYNENMLNASADTFQQTAKMMAEGMATDADKQKLLLSWILEADRKTFVYGYTDLLKLDLRQALTSINVPVLILGAPFPSKEAVMPNFEKQYANLLNKTISIAPAGRHFIMFDEPQWMYDQINNFLLQ